MRTFLIFIFFTLLFPQELQVDGDLIISGDLQSTAIESLQNEIISLQEIVDSLITIVNATKPIKIVTFNMGVLDPTDENNIVYDTTFSQNEFEEFIRIEMNVGVLQSSWASFFEVYYGPIGFEESQGSIAGTGDPAFNSSYDTFNPQIWWNIPISEDITDQQTRLYITASNGGGWPYSWGRISKLFIWGR